MKRYLVTKTLLMVLVLTAASFALSFAAQTDKGPLDDTAITSAVKAKLAKDVALKSIATIEVNATNGVVTLAGEVPSAKEKEAAETVAKSVDGVESVKNNLQVKPK